MRVCGVCCLPGPNAGKMEGTIYGYPHNTSARLAMKGKATGDRNKPMGKGLVFTGNLRLVCTSTSGQEAAVMHKRSGECCLCTRRWPRRVAFISVARATMKSMDKATGRGTAMKETRARDPKLSS